MRMVAGIVINDYNFNGIARHKYLGTNGRDSRFDVFAFVESRYHYGKIH